MRKSILAMAAIAALALSPGLPAYAKGHASGGHHVSGHHFTRTAGGDRNDRDHHVPPGWSHGRKVGWGGGHMPPGLAGR
jgi:hypothetical protein